MPKELTIDEIVEKAIPLEQCPVKKQHSIARRVWLKKQILNLIADKIIEYGPPETK